MCTNHKSGVHSSVAHQSLKSQQTIKYKTYHEISHILPFPSVHNSVTRQPIKNPQTKKEKVLNIYATSALTSALTEELSSKIKEKIVKRFNYFLYIF